MIEANAALPEDQRRGTPYRALAHERNQRLVFRRGASRVTLESTVGDGEVVETDFDGADVDVARSPHETRIGYHWSLLEHVYDMLMGGPAEPPHSTIRLNEAHVWEIVCNGGLSNLDAHLERISLASFTIRGGASDVSLALGRPSGVVPLRIRGGVGRFDVVRPKGVGVRLTVRGGVSHVSFDAMELGSVGGGLSLGSRAGADADDRYEIEIAGGVSDLSIT